MPTATKQAARTHAAKRILTVTIERNYDSDGDTSWLGEYSDRRASEFSIDRAHEEDCASVQDHSATVDQLERVIRYLNEQREQNALGNGIDAGGIGDWEDIADAQDLMIDKQDEIVECDCGRGEWHGREYRYFNPSRNYVDADGHMLPENTADDVRKYVREDYERMERLNASDWCFLGVSASATVLAGESHVSQMITSGSLWGIESDSGDSYFAEVEKEQLTELRDQLVALGFSRRAIAAAFKNAKRGGDAA